MNDQNSALSQSGVFNLTCLVMFAYRHSIAGFTEQHFHEFCALCYPHDQPQMQLFRLKVKPVKTSSDRFECITLLGIADDLADGYFIIVRLKWYKALIHDPRSQRPETFSNKLEACGLGALVLMRSEAGSFGELSCFELIWFLSALVECCELLMLKISLITPLFIRVDGRSADEFGITTFRIKREVVGG
ncbi:hypothetical protein [Pseudomonas cichorii]|uniref:hypothetical protein n=1 Tax=Pseudomonas cichorii TaxID=36746 RepID=UPI001C88FE01|nr:hypothetical protein [Pseudomonas cichorii]MBX8577885.1 hypothetical protein [Pseudomonas cichorii]